MVAPFLHRTVVASVDLYGHVNLSRLTWEGFILPSSCCPIKSSYPPSGSPKFDGGAPAVKCKAEEEWGEGTMVMKNARDLFAQTDQQISALKERIAWQREVIKRAKLGGHSTATAETIQHATGLGQP